MIEANDSKEFKEKQFEIKYSVDRPAVFVYGKGKKRANCFTSLFCFICKDILIALCIAILGGILTELFIRNCLPSTQTLSVQIASSSQSIDQSSFNLYLDNCIIEKSKVHRSGFNQVSFQYKSHGKHIMGIEMLGNQEATDQFKLERDLVWGKGNYKRTNISSADTINIHSMVYHKIISADNLVQSKFLFFSIRRPQPEIPELVFIKSPIEPLIHIYNPTINLMLNNQIQLINVFNMQILQELYGLSSNCYIISDEQLLKYQQNYSLKLPNYDNFLWLSQDIERLKTFVLELSKKLQSSILILPYIESGTPDSLTMKVLISFSSFNQQDKPYLVDANFYYEKSKNFYVRTNQNTNLSISDLIRPYAAAYINYQRFGRLDNIVVKKSLSNFESLLEQIKSSEVGYSPAPVSNAPTFQNLTDLISWANNSLKKNKADRDAAYYTLKIFWQNELLASQKHVISDSAQKAMFEYIIYRTNDFCDGSPKFHEFCRQIKDMQNYIAFN
jgi:hypothetical protein